MFDVDVTDMINVECTKGGQADTVQFLFYFFKKRIQADGDLCDHLNVVLVEGPIWLHCYMELDLGQWRLKKQWDKVHTAEMCTLIWMHGIISMDRVGRSVEVIYEWLY